jgi:hypothetical protein
LQTNKKAPTACANRKGRRGFASKAAAVRPCRVVAGFHLSSSFVYKTQAAPRPHGPSSSNQPNYTSKQGSGSANSIPKRIYARHRDRTRSPPEKNPKQPSIRSVGSSSASKGDHPRTRSRGGACVAGLEPARGMSCFAHRRWTDIARRQDGLLVFVFFISIPMRSNSNSSSNSSSISNLL